MKTIRNTTTLQFADKGGRIYHEVHVSQVQVPDPKTPRSTAGLGTRTPRSRRFFGLFS